MAERDEVTTADLTRWLAGEVHRLEAELERERLGRRAEGMRARVLGDVLKLAASRLADAHASAFEQADRLQRLAGVLNRIQAVTESPHARAEAQRSVGELLEIVAAAWQADRASLLLVVGPAGGRRPLRLAASCGLPASVGPDRMRPPIISGWVAWDQRPLVVHESSWTGAGLPLVGDRGYTRTSFVSLPLLFRGGTIGVLNLTNFPAGQPGEEMVADLQVVAGCLAWIVCDTLRLDPPHPRRRTRGTGRG